MNVKTKDLQNGQFERGRKESERKLRVTLDFARVKEWRVRVKESTKRRDPPRNNKMMLRVLNGCQWPNLVMSQSLIGGVARQGRRMRMHPRKETEVELSEGEEIMWSTWRRRGDFR
jgi:hypothetical protein